jgi:uncharacterized membrane protein YdfJ with MMPL/SSD domain
MALFLVLSVIFLLLSALYLTKMRTNISLFETAEE